ncbi:MAG TPA: S8 family peptidase [Desulfosporosinus sp.]
MLKHGRKVVAGIGFLLLVTLLGYPKSSNVKSISTENQYSKQKTVEVIVQKRPGTDSFPLLQSVGGVLVAETPIINGFVAEVPADSLAKFGQQEGVLRYTVSHSLNLTGVTDYRIKIGKGNQFSRPVAFNNVYQEIVEADAIIEKGTGVTIAVLDSGVASNYYSKTNLNVVRSVAINPSATTADDLYGHGTHVAGIINGKGPKEVTGIAPAANIINVKLGDDQGNLSEIDLLLGLQWVYDFKDDYKIKVVNLSVSSDTAGSYIDSPLSAAVEQLWLNGVTVVAAAGNDRLNPTDINYAPANDPYIITVGAVDSMGQDSAKESELATWSKHGVTAQGIIKPEVTAPGVDIISLLPKQDAILAIEHPDAIINKNYFEMSGTSMAAPVVTGTIALMLEANPSLTPNEIKSILLGTDVSYKNMADTAGVIDARKAVEIAKDKDKLAALPKYKNTWPLSSYMVNSGATIDWTKLTWGNVDWTKLTWGSVDWTKLTWGAQWNSLAK